ncbi:MAG: acyl-CoA thioesterase [Bacteroidales bacterium]|nr:acyl-CoA thioesterase [Bacteroidales bacterium]
MPALFTTTRRVEFGDTDMAGIMHFSNFFRFMEVAECDFLRSCGFTVSWSENGEQRGFPRVSASCDYWKPARFGDLLQITVSVEKIGSKSISYRYDFHRGDEAIAVGRITAVLCRKAADGEMESLVIPDAFRQQLEKQTHSP